MILVKNSHIEVTDYEWDDCANLQYLFTMENPQTHEYYYKALDYDAENKILYLPRGMNIRLIERLLKEKAVIEHSHDHYEKTGPMNINYAPKNKTQKETIKFILGAGDYEYTRPYSQLCINLMTGKGKTYVTIASIAYLEVKSIIITSLKDWLRQWGDKLVEYTGISPKEILFLNRRSIDRIINDDLDLSPYKFFLCTHKTISDYASMNSWNAIATLFEKLTVGIKVFDEAHQYFDNMSKIDYYSNTKKTLYLTASPARSDMRENEIYAMYFEMVPSIELFNKEEDAKTRYISFHFNSHPTPMQISRCRNMYGLSKPDYVKYIMDNPIFYKVAHILMNIVVEHVKGKVLMLFGTNEAILEFKEWLDVNYPEYKHNIGVYYGKVAQEDRAIQLDKKIILSNVQCAGTALDIQNLNVTIMLAAPVKSRVTAQQTFGRTGREGSTVENMMYIDLVDEGFKKLKEYYSYKQPVFLKYATECSRILYRDYDLEKEYQRVMAHRKAILATMGVTPPFTIDPDYYTIPAAAYQQPISVPFTINPGFYVTGVAAYSNNVPLPFDIVL